MFFSFSFSVDDSFEAVSEDVGSGHNIEFVVKIIDIFIDLWNKENLNNVYEMIQIDWKLIISKVKLTD